MSMAWCKTIVTPYIKWGSYNCFVPSPRCALSMCTRWYVILYWSWIYFVKGVVNTGEAKLSLGIKLSFVFLIQNDIISMHTIIKQTTKYNLCLKPKRLFCVLMICYHCVAKIQIRIAFCLSCNFMSSWRLPDLKQCLICILKPKFV